MVPLIKERTSSVSNITLSALNGFLISNKTSIIFSTNYKESSIGLQQTYLTNYPSSNFVKQGKFFLFSIYEHLMGQEKDRVLSVLIVEENNMSKLKILLWLVS